MFRYPGGPSPSPSPASRSQHPLRHEPSGSNSPGQDRGRSALTPSCHSWVRCAQSQGPADSPGQVGEPGRLFGGRSAWVQSHAPPSSAVLGAGRRGLRTGPRQPSSLTAWHLRAPCPQARMRFCFQVSRQSGRWGRASRNNSSFCGLQVRTSSFYSPSPGCPGAYLPRSEAWGTGGRHMPRRHPLGPIQWAGQVSRQCGFSPPHPLVWVE